MSAPQEPQRRQAQAEGPESPPTARRPGRLRRWVLRPLVWLFVFLLAAGAALHLVLHSDWARSRAAERLAAELSRVLDRPVSVAAVEVGLLPLGLEVHGLHVPGARPDEPPLLELPLLSVQASIESLRPLRLRLDQVAAERPRVHLLFGPDGASNLPPLPAAEEGGAPRLEIDLGQLLVHHGTLVVGERQVPLDLDARQLWARLSGGPEAGGEAPYRLTATTEGLTVTLPGARPYTAAASLLATVGSGGLELVRGHLRGPDLAADLAGSVTLEAGGSRIEVDVSGGGDLALVRHLGYLEDPPAGSFRLDGPFRLDGSGAWGPAGGGWSAALESPAVEVLERRFGEVAARVEGDAAELRVTLDGARHAGGTLAGSLALGWEEDASGGLPGRLEARFRGLDLEPLRRDLDPELPAVAGRLSGELSYRFSTAAFLDGSGDGELRVTGLRQPGGELALAGRLPVSVVRGVLAVRGGRLAAPSQTLTADLETDLSAGNGALVWSLRSEDLGPLARALPAAGDGPPPEGEEATTTWLPIGGSGEARGRIEFAPDVLRAEAAFELVAVAAAGLEIDRLEGAAVLDGDRLEITRLAAHRGTGEISAGGSVDVASGALDLTADLVAWPLQGLVPLLLEGVAVRGGLGARLTIGGTLEDPRLEATAEAAPIEVAGVAIERAAAVVAFEDSSLIVEELAVALPMGMVVAEGQADFETETLELSLRAPALDLAAEPLAGLISGGLAGEVTVEARVAGTFDEPEAELSIQARRLALGDRELGKAGAAEMQADWRRGQLEVRGSLLGLVGFDGGGRLDSQAAELSFAVRSGELGSLLALAAEDGAAPPFEGSFGGTLGIVHRFDEVQPSAARLELERLELRVEGTEIHNLEPVVARLAAGEVVIESLFLGEPTTGSELFLAGRVGLDDPMPLDLRLQAGLDASWAELVVPDLDLQGSFEALATVRGTLAEPAINGQGQLFDGRILTAGLPHGLEEVNAVVLFDPAQVLLDRLDASLAGGRVRAAGRLEMPRPGEPIRYQLQTRAEGLTLRYPEGWVLRGGAELTLAAPAPGGEGRELRGIVDLQQAFYLRDAPTGLPQLLQAVFGRRRLAVQTADEGFATTQLALVVRGKEALRVRNNLANLGGGLDLSVRGTLARPVVFGKVEIARGGTLVFRDNEYEVERGLLTFANPYRMEPVVDLVATTEVKSYDIRLTVSGPADRLDASFVSDPPLADLEVLSLLTTGRVPEQWGTGGGNVAEDLLYGQAASALSQRVNTLFGFDKFRIDPGGEFSGDIGFAIEQRLSSDVYVIFSRDPASPEREILQVEWSISDDVTLIATGEGDSSYALDVRWERSF